VKPLQEFLPAVNTMATGQLKETSTENIFTNMDTPCELNCPICGGTGFYRLDVPITHPHFGKVFICPTAAKRNIQRLQNNNMLDNRIGISAVELRELTWSSIIEGSPAHKIYSNLLEIYQRGFGFATLLGGYGLGKTLLLKIITVAAITDGKSSAYANVSDVLDDIRLAYDDHNATSSLMERMEWWCNLDVLCLDELDKVNATPWVQERLFRLLDIRYTLALREQALTFMAANYESTAQFPGYLRNRMEHVHFSPSVFILEGMDMRKVLRSKLCLTQIG